MEIHVGRLCIDCGEPAPSGGLVLKGFMNEQTDSKLVLEYHRAHNALLEFRKSKFKVGEPVTVNCKGRYT